MCHDLVMIRPLVAVALSVSVAAGCRPSDSDDVGLTTDTRSSSIADEQAQIDFLDRYVKLPSPVIETEFHIVYHDNSVGRIPGPSDWSIEFAVRVDPDDTELWTDGISPEEEPADWDEGLLDGWDVDGDAPMFYARSGTVRAVYGDDVIVQLSQTT